MRPQLLNTQECQITGASPSVAGPFKVPTPVLAPKNVATGSGATVFMSPVAKLIHQMQGKSREVIEESSISHKADTVDIDDDPQKIESKEDETVGQEVFGSDAEEGEALEGTELEIDATDDQDEQLEEKDSVLNQDVLDPGDTIERRVTRSGNEE